MARPWHNARHKLYRKAGARHDRRVVQGPSGQRTPTCGEIREILIGNDYPYLNIAIAQDIKPTRAHYHKEFDEIYFVLDGSMNLKFFDHVTEKTWTQQLGADELCVIGKGIHHKVIEASDKNRLCVITVPRFEESDEHLSDKI